MKTFGILFYLLGVNLMKEMAESAIDHKPDTTGVHRPLLLGSYEPEEDRVASTPSTSASETRDEDEVMSPGPFSPSCEWCLDDAKPMHILSDSRSPKELSLMSVTGHCSAFAGYSSSHVIDSSLPPLSVTVDLSFPDDLYNHQKSHRRARSSGCCNNTLVKYAPALGQGKLIIPFGKRISGYAEGNDDRVMGKLLKSSLVIRLNGLDEGICTAADRAPWSDDKADAQLGELSWCPSLLGHVPLQKPRLGGGHHSTRRRSASRISDLTYLSCSSSLSTCSYESLSTQHSGISQAVLRCLWNKGIPYFVYTVTGDLDEVFVASRWKVKSLDDKAVDHIYLFYSRTGSKTVTHVKVSPYHQVGKMKVSSCVKFVSSKSSIKETEFVLSASAQHDYRGQLSSSKSGIMKNHNGISKKLFNGLRACQSKHQNSISRYGDSPGSDFDDPLKGIIVDELNQFLSDPASLANPRPSNEMAAVVIRSHQSDSGRELASGGWGLKFLGKQKDANNNCSQNLSGNPDNLEVKSATQAINVLIPAGLHGGAQAGGEGPSSLIERWKTGGKCDCGGWDLGCPLTVLCDQSTNDIFFSEEVQLLESSKTVDLFVEGSKQAEPALRILDVQEGLYLVSAQANISVLQSFSIAISMIHSQIPTLCPC